MLAALLSAIAFAVLTLSPPTGSIPAVTLQRVPDGGIQPEVAVDRAGTVHLIYFKGNPAAGDLFYSRSRDGVTFSAPIRVNSVAGTAIAVGNIRGGRIAIGKSGRVYVVWNGSRVAAAANGGRTPMLYTRLNAKGTAFEPERNLVHFAYGIDGGGAVAADAAGRVYVFWHAPIPGKKGEAFRRVWVTRSEDNGKTFTPERIAFDLPTGACGCCTLDAATDANGRVYVLFRSAYQIFHRDMYLLESRDHGATFTGSDVAKWNVGYCTMSAEAFANGPRGTFAAWESHKKVQFGRIDAADGRVPKAVTVSQAADQKYPALAENKAGDLLVAWTEGMGWKRGGSLSWRVFNRSGKTAGDPSEVKGVPAWSFIAAYPRRDGKFAILY
ncbi:MAG: sialidase family protein [Bryobacteraceae bacterium]